MELEKYLNSYRCKSLNANFWSRKFLPVFADLLQCAKGPLTRCVILGVQHLAQTWQKLRPLCQFTWSKNKLWPELLCLR